MDIWTSLAAYAQMESQRLRYRPVTFADRKAFFAMAKDSTNTRFIFPPLESQEEANQKLVANFMLKPLGCWGLAVKGQSDLAGILRLEHLDLDNGRAELGYFLHKDYWGQGLMTEAVKTLSFLAFQELGLRELVIICHEENLASAKVAEKSGFRLVKSYKGSDRYSHRVRRYRYYQLKRGDYRYE